MKIIIAGAGRVGGTLAEVLTKEGHNVAVIDRDSDTINRISVAADVICIEGSATDPEALMEAEAESADLLIAATEKDEINMVSSIIAKKMGTDYVIARVRDPEYLGKTQFLQDAFGISLFVNPEHECAKEISRILRFPSAARVDSFSKGSIEIVEHKVAAGGKLDGTEIKSFSKISPAKVLVSLVEREGEIIIPNGSLVLKADDRLSITGTPNDLRRFFIDIGAYKKPVKSVIIMGGGRVSVYLANILAESGIAVSIIEESRERCEELCELLPDARIICGNASKSGVLLEENLKEKDAFIALTKDDSNNIVTALYSHNCGVAKTIIMVNHDHFVETLQDTALDCVVAPKDIVCQHIIRYVRGISNSEGFNTIETLYKLADGKAEAIEFRIEEGAELIGKPLRDVSIKDGVLIAAIIRNNKSIIPDGSTVLQSGDRAIVVTEAGWLEDINDIVV